MYIRSFMRSIFRLRNLPATIFMLLNAAVVSLIFVGFGLLQGQGVSWIYAVVGLAINTVVTLIALSPIGEAILRYQCGISLLVEDQTNASARTAFESAYRNALEKNPKISKKVRLYYMDTDDVNAFALGHRTIAVTQGLLQLPTEQIEGVIAHEFGHIAHGDSDIKLGISVSNSILMLVLILLRTVSTFVVWTVSVMSDNFKVTKAALIFKMVFDLAVITLFKLWSMIGNLLVNFTSRKCEFAADKFAYETGFGENLVDALNAIDPHLTKSSVRALVGSTHPDTYKRIEKLNALSDQNAIEEE